MKKRLVLALCLLLSLVACESKSEFGISEIEEIAEVFESVNHIEVDEGQQVIETPLINQVLAELGIELGEEHIGVVIHNPTNQQLEVVEVINYTVDPVEEGFLFIPKVIGNKIQLYEVFWDDDKLGTGDLLFEQSDLKDRQGFYLQCPVPEGIPMLKVVMEDDDQRIDYIITYDGSGMREQVELLTGELD